VAVAAPNQDRERAHRVRSALEKHELLASGAVCGIAGGVIMIAIAAAGAQSEGLAPAHALRTIGESFVGVGAFETEGARIAFGAVVHLAVSATFGVLAASLLPRDFEVASGVGVGVGFALFALGLMMSLIVPWANPGFRSGMQDIGGTWVLAHAAFGVAVGLAPVLRRRLARAPLRDVGAGEPRPAGTPAERYPSARGVEAGSSAATRSAAATSSPPEAITSGARGGS
jgi:hypothetical protein